MGKRLAITPLVGLAFLVGCGLTTWTAEPRPSADLLIEYANHSDQPYTIWNVGTEGSAALVEACMTGGYVGQRTAPFRLHLVPGTIEQTERLEPRAFPVVLDSDRLPGARSAAGYRVVIDPDGGVSVSALQAPTWDVRQLCDASGD